jgi:ABC-type glycerol-3-phosphate transport system substrate-binding protein
MKRFKLVKLAFAVLLLVVLTMSSVMYASPTEITMTCMAGLPYTEAMPKMVKAFEEKNPGIKVKIEYYPNPQILQITEVKLAAKSKTPDILFTDVPLVSAYTLRGYLAPLDKYYKNSEKNQWVPAAVKAVKVKNKIMAAPLNNSTLILFYNKKLFAEKGIAPLSKDPKKRLTYEQVVELAKKLTIDRNNDGNNDIWGFCFTQVNRTYQLLPFPQSLGAKVISSDGLKTKGIINSPKWIKAFQFYQDLFNKWRVAPKGISSAETVNFFKSGKLAMMLGVDYQAKTIEETSNLDWDYAPCPYFAGGKPITATGSWCMGLNNYSANKAAAVKFMRYLTTAPGCIEWFKADGHLSPNKKTLEYIVSHQDYQKFPLDIMKLANYEAAHTAVPRPVTPGYLEYDQTLTSAFEDIRNGSDVKKTLTNAANKIDQMLLKYR